MATGALGRSGTRMCSVKKVFLEISQSSNTVPEPFLIKLQALRTTPSVTSVLADIEIIWKGCSSLFTWKCNLK